MPGARSVLTQRTAGGGRRHRARAYHVQAPTGLKFEWNADPGAEDHGVVRVSSVQPGGQAEAKGLQAGAELVAIGDVALAGLEERHLMELVAERPNVFRFYPPEDAPPPAGEEPMTD